MLESTKKLRSEYCVVIATIDTECHTQVCLTFISKVSHPSQSESVDFGFSELLLHFENVTIGTNIRPVISLVKLVMYIV